MELHIAIQITQDGRAHLRHFQKMFPQQVSSKLANFDMPDAIQWLLRVYCNLYIFVKTASSTSAFFPPNMFLPCPVSHHPHIYSHSLEALLTRIGNVILVEINVRAAAMVERFKVDCTGSLRSWFIDLWNSTLVNFLRQVQDYDSNDGNDGDDGALQVVQQAAAEDRLDFEDPVRFVLRTWPWPDQAEGLPQVLILSHSVLSSEPGLGLNSSHMQALLKVKTESAGGQQQQRRREEEGDPLMAMLLCLQVLPHFSPDNDQ